MFGSKHQGGQDVDSGIFGPHTPMSQGTGDFYLHDRKGHYEPTAAASICQMELFLRGALKGPQNGDDKPDDRALFEPKNQSLLGRLSTRTKIERFASAKRSILEKSENGPSSRYGGPCCILLKKHTWMTEMTLEAFLIFKGPN